MKCYKCGNELTNSDVCSNCGCDVTAYKLVVRSSNSYYNEGLIKASVRDLTGAVYCLRASLSINKYNTKARNLLGLVYYEMGEVVEALTQWVMSKNYKPEKNAADVFIQKVQSNQNKLESMNQTIKKFNRCLEYAKEGSDDVAKIQLKKVISNNPNFIKAYLLLSLLLMKKGEYDKAKKSINKVLVIDRGNTLALKYLKELNELVDEKKAQADPEYAAVDKSSRKESVKDKDGDRKALSGHDVIIPKGSYKEPSNGAVTVVNLLVGVAIGAAIIWFLILPSKLKGVTYDNNKTIKEYSQKIADANAQVTRLTSQVDSLTAQLDEIKGGNTANAVNADNYSKLIDAINYAGSGNAVAAAELLASVDSTQLPSENAKSLYSQIWTQNFLTAYESLYNQGTQADNAGNPSGAADFFKRAYAINPTAEAAYYAAVAYFEAGDTANAKTYFDIFINNYPDSRFAAESNGYLSRLQ